MKFAKPHKHKLGKWSWKHQRKWYLVGRKSDIVMACAAWDYGHKRPYTMLAYYNRVFRNIPF